MPRRRNILMGLACAALLGVACADATRHRVLNFFFDGVPDPTAIAEATLEGGPVTPTAATRPGRRVVRPPLSVHAPYATDRCDGCHDAFSGRLYRTVADGLCFRCHKDTPGDLMFLHGPVAINACLTCHEPHTSIYLHLLREPEPDVCLHCHQRDDMSAGLHHGALSEDGCTMCHDPHGGDGRFFLIQREP